MISQLKSNFRDNNSNCNITEVTNKRLQFICSGHKLICF